MRAGRIQAGFAAETEDVLDWDDRKTGDRRLCETNESPVEPVFAFAGIALNGPAFVLSGARLPPAECGVIVVGAGVNDAIWRQTMRKIQVSTEIAEAKLQHGETRNVVAIAQSVDVRRDVAKVLGEEGKSAKRFAHAIEEIISRAVNPAAIDGGRFLRRNFPKLGEAAEVIEANVIASLSCPAQALDPPVVAVSAHRVPVVERIAPALAGGTEGIGRNAGDDFGSEISLEAIEFLVGPDIGAVVINKDCDIAHDADRCAGAVLADCAPLLPEKKLNDAAP